MGGGGAAGTLGGGGDGGSASNPDAGMITVGKCDGLGAVGTWQNIMPPYITAHPTYTGALVPLVNAKNPSTVYVTSDSDGVFKSTDCGATWTKVNTGKNASQLDSGRIWAAVIDPVDVDTIYAITGYGAGGVWKTTNGGVDWDQLLPAGSDIAKVAGSFVERVVMDPTNHLHLLINFHLNCAAGHTPVCFGESMDGGSTWKILDFPQSLASSWGEGSGLMILKPNVWLYEEGELFYTADAGASWKKNTPANGFGACFPGDSRITQTPDGNYYLGAQSGVMRSTDVGATWTAIPNSGGHFCPVIGDGKSLFAATLSNPENIYSAPYTDTTKWTKMSTPSLPTQLAENMYVFAYDPGHHLLYGTAQSAGIWRVVTY
jgi:hypothetical protein